MIKLVGQLFVMEPKMLRTRYDMASDGFNASIEMGTEADNVLREHFKEPLWQYSEGLITAHELFMKLTWEATNVDWVQQSAEDILEHWNSLPKGIISQDVHVILGQVKDDVKAIFGRRPQ